ncbi:MAG: PH domain-containing protein [Candidatus Krumholzibacteriota bacterium]|nr:PH domain-containing protein [Candidatus Krumholzibacteriota bacterium]
MQTVNLKPSQGYLKKIRFIITLVALLIALFGFLFGQLIGIDEGPEVAYYIFAIAAIIAILFWITAMILCGFYYRSLSYEIQDDEVIVRVGIVTKSVKHVPYRTVTNVTVKRGVLDRYLFNLGTMNIQTAGMSGTTGAEESLVGLDQVGEVYAMVVDKLRLFRGGMAPTATEEETVPAGSSAAILNSILHELRAIRQNTEK